MPRVPAVDPTQTTPLRPADIPAARSSMQPNFAAEQLQRTGATVGQVSDIAARAVLQMQDRENADAVFKAESDIKNRYLELQNGLRERKGEQAKGITTEADDWWEKQGGEALAQLQNDPQKRVFGQTLAKLREQSMGSLSAYEAGERRRAAEQSAEASIVGSINLAASQVGTPTEREAVAGAKSDVLKRLGVLRQLNGWDENYYTAKQAESLTNLHMQVIQNKVDRDPAGAREYFDLNKAEINGTQHNTIERALKVSTTKQTAQAMADELAAQGLSEVDGLKVIRDKLSGDDEAAAVQEWKVRVAEIGQARERAQRDAADEAWGIFARRGYGAIPSSLMARLDGQVIVALQRAARERAGGEKEPKTDSEVYYALRQLMANDPDKFRTMDLRTVFPSLSRADREEFIKLQTKPEDIKDAVGLDAQLSNMHDQMKWDAGDREKKGVFDRTVGNAINDEQKRIGRKLNYEERQKIIDRMVIEGTVAGSGWLFDDKRKVYEVQGTADAEKFVPKVPKDERKKIEDALRRAGRIVDDAAVLELYRKKTGL